MSQNKGKATPLSPLLFACVLLTFALQRRRWMQDVPQWLIAAFTGSWCAEMDRQEVMALVIHATFVWMHLWLLSILLGFTLSSIQHLNRDRD